MDKQCVERFADDLLSTLCICQDIKEGARDEFIKICDKNQPISSSLVGPEIANVTKNGNIVTVTMATPGSYEVKVGTNPNSLIPATPNITSPLVYIVNLSPLLNKNALIYVEATQKINGCTIPPTKYEFMPTL